MTEEELIAKLQEDPTWMPDPGESLFRLEPPIVTEPDERGDREVLLGGMFPSQREFYELDNHICVFIGGYGTGKSQTAAKIAVAQALHNAPVPVVACSPTYDMSRKAILPHVINTLDELKNRWGEEYHRGLDWVTCPKTGKRYQRASTLSYTHYKASPQRIVIEYTEQTASGKRTQPLEAVIEFVSAEHPDRLKGSNIACAIIDEPFLCDEEAFKQLVVRARHPLAKDRKVYLCGTPEQLNWGYDLVAGELGNRYDVGVVRASTMENLTLNTYYIENLIKSFDERTARAYLHGEFVLTSKGMVFYAFTDENIQKIQMPENATPFMGVDFNVNPFCAVVGWYTEGTSPHCHVIDEIILENSDTAAVADLIMKKYGNMGVIEPYCVRGSGENVLWQNPISECYPDSNAGRSTNAPGGRTDYDWLQEAGFEVHRNPRGNPLLKDRRNAVNLMLEDNRLTIDPRCKSLIKSYATFTHENSNKPLGKSLGHILDAAQYIVARKWPAGAPRTRFNALRLG